MLQALIAFVATLERGNESGLKRWRGRAWDWGEGREGGTSLSWLDMRSFGCTSVWLLRRNAFSYE